MKNDAKLTRWRIRNAPTKKDPQRRLLMVKAALPDVHALIRRFGAVCGRPKKERGGKEFNYNLYLHKIPEEELAKMRRELTGLAGAEAGASAAGELPDATPAPDEADGSAQLSLTPVPSSLETPGGAAESGIQIGGAPAAGEPAPAVEPGIQIGGAPAAGEPAPAAESGIQIGGAPAAGEQPPVPGAGIPAAAPENPPAAAASYNPAPTPVDAPPAEQGEAPITLGDPFAAAQPAAEPAVPGGGAFAGQGAAKEVAAPQRKAVEEPLSGGLAPLDPLRTLENMSVGGFNRFAHAAAMSVMSSPGTMYNPLFFSGPAGSGKSHMLQALGHKLQEQAPDQPVLMTTGARLARAVAAAARTGRAAEFDAFSEKSRALIIDDFHMMGITEGNRDGLAKIIAHYLGSGKQVVLSSLYPQKLLGALEDALGFKIAAGHSVEFRQPGESAMKEIALAVLERIGGEVDQAGKGMFVDRAIEEYSNLEANARRIRLLSELRKGRFSSSQGPLEMLFGADSDPVNTPAAELAAALTQAPPEGTWPLALLFPAGREVHANWAWQQLYSFSQSNGGLFPFKKAAVKPYEVEPVFGVPFAVAGECYNPQVDAALVIGPPPGCDLVEHEGDFRYALDHLLHDAAVPFGFVPFQRIKDPKAYLLAYLDLMAGAPAGEA